MKYQLKEVLKVRLKEDNSLLKCIDCTPQEIFFNIVNFLGEVIHKAKSVGYTLVMKLDCQASRLLVKDLTKIGEEYRVFNGELVYQDIFNKIYSGIKRRYQL